MFNTSPKEQTPGAKDTEVLTKTQLQQLKSAFSDLSLTSKDHSARQQQYGQQQQLPQKWESPLLSLYSRVKNTFYDLNSRGFMKYAQYSSYLNIRRELESRPDLLKLNITINALEFLSVVMCIMIPNKWINKLLLSTTNITIYIYFLQKFMLNYYIEQIALVNNRMEPVEQQARNLIEYKYRIQNINPLQRKQPQNRPSIQKLLEEVDKKNLQYLRFKKVELLL